MSGQPERNVAAEQRFADVFSHLGLITAYAQRRGVPDPDDIAADVMTIAWRRLTHVPVDDPRPWLIATARNLILADRRKHPAESELDAQDSTDAIDPLSAIAALDPELESALRTLSHSDREALLLLAWEDLTPKAAAASLGITQAAFRVRLHRARRRLIGELESDQPSRRAQSRRAPVEEP
ncbi:MAG TPA: sigma-70 family RNA polymerase sigma factor [Solirubrobacteraceae bacterium]|jgi:RNA polymerase sigma-70 factor (ECF subfamily)|nr:sigma-70 family RNA polymerase sigma factor [Solirubrobacteraceae bacterium]